MASIRRRGARFQARISRKGHPSLARSFSSRQDAQAWARKTESEIERQVWIGHETERDCLTLHTALERYKGEITPGKKGASQERYRIGQLQRAAIASVLLVRVRGTDVAKLRDAMLSDGYAPASVCLALALLSHVFTTARQEWGYEKLPNPVAAVRKPLVRNRRERRLTPEEEAKLFDACRKHVGGWLADVVTLALETAMRRSEIAALRWENINLNARTALLPDTKNGTARTVPLSPRAIETLQSLGKVRPIEGRVLRVNPDAITAAFETAVKRAGLTGIRLHDLRHCATSRLFERGLNVMEVAAITGHKTLSMLKRYTHLRAEDLAKKLAS